METDLAGFAAGGCKLNVVGTQLRRNVERFNMQVGKDVLRRAIEHRIGFRPYIKQPLTRVIGCDLHLVVLIEDRICS